MNYRHAYHAGNFADVVKHIIVTRVIAYLQRKEAGLFMLDTHAGIGRYDLSADEAIRTGEAAGGITAFMSAVDNAPEAVTTLVEPYRAIVARFNPKGVLAAYPGSPRILHGMRRPQDRISLTELHEQDHKLLAAEFAGAHGVKTHKLDGWLALKSQLPPRERRALVLIDPPYEARGEFETVIAGLRMALKRFAGGTYCVWYPIKHTDAVKAFHASLDALGHEMLLCELEIAPPQTPDGQPRLFGTGMAIINPPYVLADELGTVLPWLAATLETSPGARQWRLTALNT